MNLQAPRRLTAIPLVLCALLAFAGILSASCRASLDSGSQMLLGNPDGASASAANREHYLIKRPQYALSYNDTLRFPNWVAWHLSAKDVGTVERGQFVPDTTLPSGFTQVTPNDYTNSGYDRGHNCPSKDRSDSRQDNDALFLMTNMTPQAHGLNAGPWERLESYCRDLAKQGNEIYIVCGHGFSSSKHPTFGRSKVAVPDFAWKIVVVVPKGRGADRGRIGGNTRVIAVRMPNVNTISNQPWGRYVVTPAQIEQATRLHFFDALPGPVAGALRMKRDSGEGGGATKATNLRPAAGGTAKTRVTQPPAGRSARVWVNTRSGVYWRPGSEYYGKTKQGRYMLETEAIKAGYRAASGQ